MDKKPLLMGSIGAVILLIMGSLSTVVGYQSVQSTTVDNSPLFATRTKRATNQEEVNITLQYLGMGQEELMHFPSRDTNDGPLMKAIEFIRTMDHTTFAQFTKLVLQRCRQDNSLMDTNPALVIQILSQLRVKSGLLLHVPLIITKDQPDLILGPPTINWFPGCLLLFFFVFLLTSFYAAAFTVIKILSNILLVIYSFFSLITVYYCPGV
jgi:hypothetical protein